MFSDLLLAMLIFPALAAGVPAAEAAKDVAGPPGADREATQAAEARLAADDRPLAGAADELPPSTPRADSEPPAPPAAPESSPAPAQQSGEQKDRGTIPDQGTPPRTAIGLSLGANTISANGVQLLWRSRPHFGWAVGVGLGSSWLRYGAQGRFYLLPLVSSPYFGLDVHANSGKVATDQPRHDSEGNETGGTFGYTTEFSVLLGLSAGWHLVWDHFFVDPAIGWSVLAAGGNFFTDAAPGTLSDYDLELARGDRGGPQLGVTAGFTW